MNTFNNPTISIMHVALRPYNASHASYNDPEQLLKIVMNEHNGSSNSIPFVYIRMMKSNGTVGIRPAIAFGYTEQKFTDTDTGICALFLVKIGEQYAIVSSEMQHSDEEIFRRFRENDEATVTVLGRGFFQNTVKPNYTIVSALDVKAEMRAALTLLNDM